MALLAPPDHAEEYLNPIELSAIDDDGISSYKRLLEQADERLNQAFYQWHNISRLVRTRAWVVEQFVLQCWQQSELDQDNLCLMAVGGFGRGDLQPHSDVDLLLLYDGSLPEKEVSQFIQMLWDLGLDIGHAVRTVEETVALAAEDITVATNVMESRFMRGEVRLFDALVKATSDEMMWAGPAFFEAKYQEQLDRHARWGGTAYNLEPNIKEGHGGLRDIQVVRWVAQRHFHVDTMHGLVDVGFLTPDEYMQLQKGMRKLWKIRYALHLLSGRKEDRLLFEHQKQLAEMFSYEGNEQGLAVEQFMQAHYRNAQLLEQLNMRLLQLFEENILQHDDKHIQPLTDDFIIINQFLEVRDQQVFVQRPAAMFEVFHHYQQHPEIKGIRANTLRHLSQSVYLIDNNFRSDPKVRSLFLGLFQHEHLVYRQLSLMNTLGLLGAYLPVFGHIIGRMQFDRFHMYTVDQHSLFVLRNLRQLFLNAQINPRAHAVTQRISQPYVLHLAGFFHDIAKGRGGDHAELGAVDADAFARDFDLPDADRELLAWLVKYHLIMSVVAQKQDISDGQVIEKFAHLVGDQKYLDHLYLLTIADITGTDPKLWNSYKDALLNELYVRTTRFFAAEQEADLSAVKALTLKQLSPQYHGPAKKLWDHIPPVFFEYFQPEQIAQMSEAIADNEGKPTVKVLAMHSDGFEVMLYGLDHRGLFHQVVKAFSDAQITVADARIYTASHGYVLDCFHCLGDCDERPFNALKEQLMVLLNTQEHGASNRIMWVKNKAKIFHEPPVMKFSSGRHAEETRFDIVCADHAGLLVNLTGFFLNLGIDIHGAKIATFGDRAEDVFWLSDQGQALNQGTREEITQACLSLLSAE